MKAKRMAKPVVGKDVDSWCTRCKLMLAHTIEAVSGDKITRVHCNTCKSQHAFRANPPARVAPRKGRSAAGTKDGGPAPDSFEALMRGKDPHSARRYVLAERFKQGELIKHSQFGLGVVRSLKGLDKIEVVFADTPRTLVHGHRV
jgi:hypothetical protein